MVRRGASFYESKVKRMLYVQIEDDVDYSSLAL